MTIADIITPSNKVPGAYIKLTFGVGERSPGDAPIKVLAFGNKLSAGTAAVEVVERIFDEASAETLFGQGSELHLMCREIIAENRSVELYAIAVTESGGAQATTTITFASTATADGEIVIDVDGVTQAFPIDSGTTHIAAAASIAALWNAGHPDSSCTGSDNGAGVLTFTAKQAGTKGNSIRVASKGSATGLTWTNIDAYLTGGTTDDDPQTALDNVFASKYDILVSPEAATANLQKFITHVDAQAEPTEGRLARIVASDMGTIAASITRSDSTNSDRLRVLWYEDGRINPARAAAAFAGLYSRRMQSDRAYNYDGEVIDALLPQWAEASRPTNTEIENGLNNGLIPIGTNNAGQCYVSRAITNKHNDANGNPDWRTLDVHKVDVPDVIADDLKLNFGDTFDGFKLAEDVDGEMPPPGVATPKTIKDWIIGRLLTYDAETNGANGNYLVDILAMKDNVVVEIASGSDGRVNASIPLNMVELLHQFAADLRQVG